MGFEDSVDEQGVADVDGAPETDGGVYPASVSEWHRNGIVGGSTWCLGVNET